MVLTGSISYAADDPAKAYIVVPLTKATLLQYFGPGGAKAADTAFFCSADDSSVVLASNDGATVYLTLTAMTAGTSVFKPEIIVSKAKTQFAGSGIFPTGGATKAVLVGTFSAVSTGQVIKAR